MRTFLKWLACIIFLAALAGCTAHPPAKTEATATSTGVLANEHLVKRGETLYAISLRYSIDYRQLARLNGINAPYTIYPGQKITLQSSKKAPAKSKSKPATRAGQSTVSTKPLPMPPPALRASTKTPQKPAVAASNSQTTKNTDLISDSMKWSWPTHGKVIAKFDPADPTKNGIEIEGEKLQAIQVAAAGLVVYSGSGLVGYGNLVIVKHNDVYLTAYGYNAEVLVKEGEELKAGTVIAKMGHGLDQRPALHFEVRKKGRPVNPILYLPKR